MRFSHLLLGLCFSIFSWLVSGAWLLDPFWPAGKMASKLNKSKMQAKKAKAILIGAGGK